MTRYAMLTDEPDRLRRVHGDCEVTPFASAVGALTWERRLRSEGLSCWRVADGDSASSSRKRTLVRKDRRRNDDSSPKRARQNGVSRCYVLFGRILPCRRSRRVGSTANSRDQRSRWLRSSSVACTETMPAASPSWRSDGVMRFQ